MSTFIVNGEQITVTTKAPIMISDVLSQYFSQQAQQQNTQQPTTTAFAVAVNQNFVAQTEYAHTEISAGSVIDLFSPIQGG